MGCSLFFPNLTKISPLFVPLTVASESLTTRMKQRALSACQPGLPLPCYSLIACGLSVEIVSSLVIHQWDSQSHGHRRAVPPLQPRASTPDGLHQKRKSYPHPHPQSTAGSVLFSSSGRFTDCHSTTFGTKWGRIWPQIKDLTNVSYKLAWVSALGKG